MALIKCPKCNHEISDTTKKCIHCKTKIKSKNNTFRVNYKIVIPISIVILFFAVSFIAYKIVDNRIIYLDENKDIEENNNIEDNTTNNETALPPTESENKENDSNNESSNNSNNNTNNNTTNKPNNSNNANNNNNNTSNNTPADNTPKKTIIDATKNESCPSGYTYQDGAIYSDAPCEKTDITYGTLTYSCGGSMVLIGDKCEMTFTSAPYNGECYGKGYVLNGDICEKKEQFDAMISGLQCPIGYSKYVIDKNDTRCYKSNFVKQNISYSCPSGYTLNGNKCEK